MSISIPFMKSKIRFSDLNREIEATDYSLSVLEHSIKNKVPLLHECGGHGLCTTCRIRVLDGINNLTPPTKLETNLQNNRGWDPSVRLGCQTRLLKSNATIERLIWTNAEISNIQLETIPYGIGEERDLIILFCDMRNFTKLADHHSNFDLAHMLNRFFTVLGDPVFMNNGIIYQYAGDEIVALFGAGGGNNSKNAMDAVRAALGMVYAIQRLNKWELREFEAEMDVGIGIHFGRAFVGNIGHPRHKQFAVIGDVVNVTSRIQAQNKELKTKILASEAFFNILPENSIVTGLKSVVHLKGKDQRFLVHEIVEFRHSDINLEVQRTLNELLKNEEEFASRFYEKLFAKAPSVKKLFTKNMIDQGKMLTHMLRGIIYSLSRPEYLALGLQTLGKQHQEYGVKNEHYDLIKEILLEAIGEELGELHTENVKKAWEEAVSLIIQHMNITR